MKIGKKRLSQGLFRRDRKKTLVGFEISFEVSSNDHHVVIKSRGLLQVKPGKSVDQLKKMAIKESGLKAEHDWLFEDLMNNTDIVLIEKGSDREE